MSCTIDATAGGASANSYATVAEGDTYHVSHLYADDWTDADATEKCQALQMATRLLDQWFEWAGVAATSTQALLWPRANIIGPNGYLVNNATIPARIREATAELARQLIAADRTADSDTEGVKRVKAGSVEVEFTGAGGVGVIPDAVIGFVSCFGQQVGTSSGAVSIHRA